MLCFSQTELGSCGLARLSNSLKLWHQILSHQTCGH